MLAFVDARPRIVECAHGDDAWRRTSSGNGLEISCGARQVRLRSAEEIDAVPKSRLQASERSR